MILNSSQKEFADTDRARLEAELSGPDLSDVQNVSLHIPGHRRLKWGMILGFLALGGLLWFAWKVGG